MLVKPKFYRERKEKLYEREIAIILHKTLSQKNNLPLFSLTYCNLDVRGKSLKIFVNIFQKRKKDELVKSINKEYSPILKKELAKSKNFAYIPNISFLIDINQETNEILEKIIREKDNKI